MTDLNTRVLTLAEGNKFATKLTGLGVHVMSVTKDGPADSPKIEVTTNNDGKYSFALEENYFQMLNLDTGEWSKKFEYDDASFAVASINRENCSGF